MTLDRPLTFKQLAAELKLDDSSGRRLKNLVLQRERETKTVIAIRGSGKKQPKMKVTLAAIYQNLPELKPQRSSDDSRKHVRAYLEAIDERVSEIVARELQRLVMPLINEDRRRLAALEQKR